jgi:hypothetical protein
MPAANPAQTASSDSPAAQGALLSRCKRALTPQNFCIFILFLFSFPGLYWMCPSITDRLESYQPLQALKFFATRGQAFHKYGPFPNFVLAPWYGVTLAVWHFMGKLKPPYSTYPFGFANPLVQMNLLIIEGRFVFMALCLWSAYLLVKRMARLSGSWLLITAVSLALIASNYNYNAILSSTRPDALMMAFGTLFMVVYLDATMDGLTLRRGVLLGLCAVSAVSSKELIYAMFVLPILFLIVRAALGKDPTLRSGKPLLRWTLITGLVTFGAYALVNIVYAPYTWVARMRYWSSGEGLDPSIWGSYSAATNLRNGLLCALENLGLGGAVLVVAAMVVFLVRRPRYSLALSMPALSFVLFAIAEIHYTEIRYFMPLSIALPPLVLLGLEELRIHLENSWKRPALQIALTCCLIANLVWGSYTWYFLSSLREVVIRKQMLSSPKDQTYYIYSTYKLYPGSNVLSNYGYRLEDRAFQEILDSNGPWPDVIYITTGTEGFIRDAVNDSAKFPERVDFLERLGFNATGWTGFEQLGYCRVAVIPPWTPSWFPHKWMYGVREQERIESVEVYSRHCP